jgi:hypothetical protein
MASLFYMPFRPAYDSAGISVPGAQAWFTVTGTNTPAPIYADNGLTTPLANPLPANGVGKFPAAYMDDAVSYRVRIYAKNATVGVDTPLEEMEPYTLNVFDAAANAALAATLAAAAAADTSSDAAGAAATAAAASATAADVSADTAVASLVSSSSSATSAGLSAAAALALANGYLFDTAAEGVSQGVVSLTITAAGSGGANGQFALAFSGGGGTLAAGTFTVSGGAVTAVNLTKRGKNYTSNPTVSTAASTGLTGATVTAAKGNYAVPDGEYFLVKGTGDTFATLYKNVGGVATAQSLSIPSLTGITSLTTAAIISSAPSGAVALWPIDNYVAANLYIPNIMAPTAASTNLKRASRHAFNTAFYYKDGGTTVSDRSQVGAAGLTDASRVTIPGAGRLAFGDNATVIPAGQYTMAATVKRFGGSDQTFAFSEKSDRSLKSAAKTATSAFQRFSYTFTLAAPSTNFELALITFDGATTADLIVDNIELFSGAADLGPVTPGRSHLLRQVPRRHSSDGYQRGPSAWHASGGLTAKSLRLHELDFLGSDRTLGDHHLHVHRQ